MEGVDPGEYLTAAATAALNDAGATLLPHEFAQQIAT